MNETINTDYIVVYRDNGEEYQFLIEFRKLSNDNKKRLSGYMKALLEMEKKM